MSICIMHRLNKRVAVLSDVVEHDGGGERVAPPPPAKQLLTGGEFSTPFTSCAYVKINVRSLSHLFPTLAHATRHITHDAYDNDYEVVVDVATMMAALVCPSPLISDVNRNGASRRKFCRVLLPVPMS